jgi:hypothetical protein
MTSMIISGLLMCSRDCNFNRHAIDPSNVSLRCELADHSVHMWTLRYLVVQPGQTPLRLNAIFPTPPQTPIYDGRVYAGPSVIAFDESQANVPNSCLHLQLDTKVRALIT